MRACLLTRVFIVALSLLGIFPASSWSSESEQFTNTIAPVLRKHCAKCHGAGEDVEGDVNLVALNGNSLVENVELVRNVIEALDIESMPPEDEPQLEPDVRKTLLTQLKAVLHASVSSVHSRSRTPVRRMNRFQYNNAVIDLLDLKCIVFTLPERMMREHKGYFKPASGRMADVVSVGNRPLGKSQMIEPRLAGVAAFPQDLRAEHGFNNRGDHLSLSPLLLESFLNLGQSITQSPDFIPRNVGIWKALFQPPKSTNSPANSPANTSEQVRKRLHPFLTRAFRQPIEESVLDRYVAFVANQTNAGIPYTEAMKAVVAATISSPKFFYLYDQVSQTGENANIVDDFELASRMAFFLWGSIPDQVLLDLASKGRLNDPEVLTEQFERMVKDHKMKRFCDSFPSQWLQLDRLISSAPDKEYFPQFYNGKYRLSMHMLMEPLLIFETVLIENQPITQLIDSDFTYRSKLLQKSYGERSGKPEAAPKVQGNVGLLTFVRTPVSDRRYGGVITNSAVMTMTSGPTRTKPITRGAWVLSAIFNNPPDPPPADVPPLDETPPKGEEKLTLRERLSIHRERTDCKGCHEQIDPLGFALENFDAVGRWRDKYENDREVDMEGVLFRKHDFSSVVEFKDAILAEKDRFARALAGHLLSFAVARELTAHDEIALDKIVAATVADGYKMQTLLKQVILCQPFQLNHNPAKPATPATEAKDQL